MRAFATKRGIAALLGAILVPCSAFSGDGIPESAAGRALGAPAYLLDGPELVFRLPQLVTREIPSLLVVGTSSTETAAHGVITSSRGVKAGYFVERESRLFVAPVDDIPFHRLAIAGDWRGWEAGASFGWSTLGKKQRRERVRNPGDEPDVDRDDYFQTSDVRQFSLGAGRSFPGFSVDAVIEWRREEFDYRRVSTTVRPDPVQPYYSRREFRVRADGGYRTGFAARARIGDPENRRATLWVSRRDVTREESFRQQFEVERIVHGDAYVLSELDVVEREEPGESWEVGLLAEGPAGSIGRVGIHGSWERTIPGRAFSGWRSVTGTQETTESRVRLGTTLSMPWLRATTLLAGFSVRLDTVEEHRRGSLDEHEVPWTVESLGSYWSHTQTDERMLPSAGWGIVYDVARIRLTGALSTDLSPLDLFVSLDARIAL